MTANEIWKSALTPNALAYRLAAFVPATLTKRLISTNAIAAGQVNQIDAATMFVDISGFTAMSEALAADGPRGAEELNRVLLLTFDAMIAVIHQLGGAVAHFYGDAMAIYFPDNAGKAVKCALACGHALQELVASRFQRVEVQRPFQKNHIFELTVKIGISYGRCHEIILGDEKTGYEFVVMGTAVDAAAQAEKQAGAGEIIVTQTALAQIGQTAETPFIQWGQAVVAPTAQPVLASEAYQDPKTCTLLARLLAPFVSAALYERLNVSGPSGLAEHRPVTNFFIRFTFKDADSYAATGILLHKYYRWVGGVVARYGQQNARINRVLTGDKGYELHIIFGAPVAPDAPEQTLLCALALQRERPPYVSSQQIGVTSGKVFAAPVGSASRREYTIVGDIVNIAARLTDLCPLGEVLTDAATAERAAHVVDLLPLAPVYLKGKQIEVIPYRVQRVRSVSDQLDVYYGRFLKPLVGREQDHARLLGLLDAALGGHGSLAAISGAAGVGKTRLLAHGVTHWLDAGGKGLLGICYQHNTDTPYGPWRAIWRNFFELSADMEPLAQVTAVIQKTEALLPNIGADVGLWAELLGLPFPQNETLKTLPAEVRRTRFFNLVRGCLAAAALQLPHLIILEGIQWADKTSLDLLAELLPHLADLPLFIALTVRPQIVEPIPLLGAENCTTIELDDLLPEDARRYLQDQIGTTVLPAQVEQQLGLRDRDGRSSTVNPLFLEEALQEMIARGVLQVNGRVSPHNRVQVNEALLSQMQIPDTIHGLLLARIDRLPAANRGLLQVASVIGRQFALESLAAIMPETPVAVVADLLTDLTTSQMTQLVTADPEWTYLFEHAMTHEVAYGSLPFARRQALHAALADWMLDQYADNLKPFYSALAYHYSQAHIHEEGLRYALDAANEARNIFANQEAIGLYTLAEKHLVEMGVEKYWETAVEIYLSRGQTHWWVGAFDNALSDAQDALSLAQKYENIVFQAQAYNLIAEIKYRQAHYEEAISSAQQALALEGVNTRQIARAYHWMGNSAIVMGEFEFAMQHLKMAEEMSLQIHDQKRQAQALEGIAYIYYIQKKLELARQNMRRSVDILHKISDPMNTASALNNIAVIEYHLGRVNDAVKTIDEALLVIQNSSRNFRARMLVNRAEFLCYLGWYEEANLNFTEAQELFDRMDDEEGLVGLYLHLANDYFADLDDWFAVSQYLNQAESIIKAQPAAYPEQNLRLHIGLSRLCLVNESLDQAIKHLDFCDKLIDEKQLVWWMPAVLYYQGLAYKMKQSKELSQINLIFQRGLTAIEDNGSPDFRALLLLEQARSNLNETARNYVLQECIQAVAERARYRDRVYCLETAGHILKTSSDSYWQKLGLDCLKKLKSL